MKKNILPLLLTAPLLLVIAALVVQNRQLNRQLVLTSAELTAARHSATSAPLIVDAPAPPSVAATPPAATSSAPTPARPAGPGFPAAMFDNPAVQSMMAAATKGSLDQRYGRLFRQLRLDPAALERFKNLLTERQMTALDTVRAAQAQGLDPAAINSLLNTAAADIDDNIRALLGAPAYTQLQSYEQNLGAYGVLDQFEKRIGFTTTPLDDTQSAAILKIIAETAGSAAPAGAADDPMFRVMQGMGVGPPMMSALSQPHITDKTIETAATVLNPGQLEVLRQLQTDQQGQLSALRTLRGK